MAWTATRTWSVGELVTAANMNTYVSADLQFLYDCLFGGGSVTNPGTNLTLPNNIIIYQKDSGGTARGVIYLDGSNVLREYIGASGFSMRESDGVTVVLSADGSGNFNFVNALRVLSGTGATAGGVKALALSSDASFGVYQGSGAPTISASKGSLYLRTDGSSTSTRAYINTDGATTWTAITTAA